MGDGGKEWAMQKTLRFLGLIFVIALKQIFCASAGGYQISGATILNDGSYIFCAFFVLLPGHLFQVCICYELVSIAYGQSLVFNARISKSSRRVRAALTISQALVSLGTFTLALVSPDYLLKLVAGNFTFDAVLIVFLSAIILKT